MCAIMVAMNDFEPRATEFLSDWTTLELGGQADHFFEAESGDQVGDALRWAREHGQKVHILGGGSNLVVSDEGVRGLVLRVNSSGIGLTDAGDDVAMNVAAGEAWDEVVAVSVERGLVGLECLSGIPGTAGATPIQNVGAYGAEVADVLESVEVMDCQSLEILRLDKDACGFSYRSSCFRRNPGRYVVLAVDFRLRRTGPVELRYEELRRAMEQGSVDPGPAEVRSVVLELRRSKGMVVEEGSPSSVGSFFVNPVVGRESYERIVASAGCRVPAYRLHDGRFKIPAAWLIEHAGVEKGFRHGGVAVSSHHSLALIHHGGSTTRELLELATKIRERVRSRFAVVLKPEPVFWGFGPHEPWEET